MLKFEDGLRKRLALALQDFLTLLLDYTRTP